LEKLPDGSIDPRTGQRVGGYGNWTTHPNNPAAKPQEASATSR
jgi:dihydropyrimidine dehydrogenase (NAD+) subunit PreA